MWSLPLSVHFVTERKKNHLAPESFYVSLTPFTAFTMENYLEMTDARVRLDAQATLGPFPSGVGVSAQVCDPG